MKSSDPVPVVTINEANPVVVAETVDTDMEEEDANQVSEVEELPHGFFHSTETFPDDVSGVTWVREDIPNHPEGGQEVQHLGPLHLDHATPR